MDQQPVTTLNVYPGIGDIMWVFHKAQEIFPVMDVNISAAGIKRSADFVKMIDGVRNVTYKNFTRPEINKKRIPDNSNLEDYIGKGRTK